MPRASGQFEPQQNSTPISSALDKSNEIVPNTPSTSTPTGIANVKIKTELDYHLGDDSDVICLGEKSMDCVDLVTDDPSTQELFLRCDDNSIRENLITVQTQPSPSVSKVKLEN